MPEISRQTRREVPEWRKIRSIGIEREGQVYYFEYDEGPPGDGQFRVETVYTGLSAGTELTFYKGTNPYLHSHYDEGFGLFYPGGHTIAYPVPFLGYMEVGRVIQSRTDAVREGQILGMNYGHKSGHTAHPAFDVYLPLPETIDPILGIYVHQMGPICANGLLHAAHDLYGANVGSLGDGVRGRNILVMGAGVVGLITALFARLYGANVAIADKNARRLEAASGLGLIAVDENTLPAWQYAKETWHDGGKDRGADVVFQCRATGDALSNALKSLRPQGTVIDLAFYQGGLPEVNLGEEFHHNGLSLRCAQINRVPRGLAFAWTRRRLMEETLALLEDYGDLIRQYMITDIVPYDEAGTLLHDLSTRQRDIIQAVFALHVDEV